MAKQEKSQQYDYQALQQELDDIMAKLESTDVPIDTVVELYERGLEVVRTMERHLQNAENVIIKLSERFDAAQ
ncbi:exodeoxyribonuclease VII small subunit [Candidatus Saccharibacteria bacterium]|nr:MAG: exodeoxyribonuclease VII small subunit [Candidatus Saccharibacteria bacterium]